MKFEYMMETEKLLPYYQFPKFLLELPLSQNARILYDRILEMCVPLYVDGSSHRSDIAHENNGKNEDLFLYCRIKSD